MSPEERICKYCGEQFTARRKDMVFCTTNCGTKYAKSIKLEQRVEKKICKYCEREFLTSDKTKEFCTRECLYSWQSANYPRTKFVVQAKVSGVLIEVSPKRKTKKEAIDYYNTSLLASKYGEYNPQDFIVVRVADKYNSVLD